MTTNAEAMVEAASPVVFSHTIGLFMPASANVAPRETAVLFVSSWGFEELCSRKLWRIVAEQLHHNGMASLRFDYPGTGDALDLDQATANLDLWLDSIEEAAALLLRQSGVKKLLIVAHSIGATLAWQRLARMENVAGIALLAPARSGRRWIREFMALSRIADHGAIKHAVPRTGPTMGEQTIPEGILSGLRGLEIADIGKNPSQKILLLTPEERPADPEFVENLKSQSEDFSQIVFSDYDCFIRDVLLSIPPPQVISELTNWILSRSAVSHSERGVPGVSAQTNEPVLAGDGFIDRPIRFASGNRLYGIISEPTSKTTDAKVIILSTGYDRMSGWGRITTRICRNLARSGITAMRFDFTNIADSPPSPGVPYQVMFNEALERDVGEALTLLSQEGDGPIILSGRCSGGYTAFKSAVRYHEVKGVLPVNPFDFGLEPDTDIDTLLLSSLQPLSSYAGKMRSGNFWIRVLRGEVNIAKGVRNLWRMLIAKGVSLTLPLLLLFPQFSGRRRAVTQEFELLNKRQTRMKLIYSNDDVGVPNLEARFGKGGYLLKRYQNASLHFMEDADHNLTTAPARQVWFEELKAMVKQVSPEARLD